MDNKEINGNVPSPTMEDVKITYDLEFLNLLKNSPFSKMKPENIGLTEILTDNTNKGQKDAIGSNLLPPFARGSRNNTLPNRRSQAALAGLLEGKPSVRPNTSVGSPRPGVRQISISLRSDVKLNETENAWRPSRMRSENMEEEEKETQEVLKKFRSTLNKLTPQKFDTLMGQVRELDINTMERLKGVISLVFEKAIEEPNFSVTYALMCKELEQIKVEQVAGEKPTTFRQLIVGSCQEEFLKGDTQDNKADEKQKEIEECTDPEKKKELQIILEEEKRKIRMRKVGNVRFIGELFKQGIITSKIMIICIEKLLEKLEEETLECLCKLLTTIGKDLEQVHNKDLGKYFLLMQAIVDKKKGQNISSRVRFMIQDVIDLRGKKWVPRKIVEQSKPKTIDQIQLEAEMEQMLTYQNNYNTPSTPRQEERDRDRPMNKRGASRSVNDDGWTLASSRNTRTKFVVDSEKLSKMSSFSTSINQTSLSPATVSWDRGVSSKNNMFSSRNNNNNNNNSVKKNNSTESKNMYSLLQEATGNDASSNQAPPQLVKKMTREMDKTPAPISEPILQFSDDDTGKIHDVMTRCQNDDVYRILDMVDTYLVKKGIDMDFIVKEMILWAIEFSKVEKIQTIGEVTGRMVHKKDISREKFIEVFKKVIDTSFDLFLEGDETAWDLLAGFIWGHQVKNPLTMPEIHIILTKIVQIGKGYEFLLAFFNTRPDEKARALWVDGKMSLSEWFPLEKEKSFRKNVKIQCFGHIQITNFENALEELLVLMQDKTPIKTVEEWITGSIANPEELWFIRALTEAVYTYVLLSSENAKPRFDDVHAKQRLDAYYPLLITYIGNKRNAQLELNCLYAIQHLLHKLEHPMNISLQIFEHLCDSGEVVSNEVFLTWEESKDPLEQEGKGVMLKSLTSFITALKSNEYSSDDDGSP